MATDSMTLALEGNVTLGQFAVAAENLRRLIVGLSREIDRGARIDWLLDNLSAGSAIVTVRGEAEASQDNPAVEAVVGAFEVVADALQRGTAVPYSSQVARAGQALVGLLNGQIEAIRFETPNRDVTIVSNEAQGRAQSYTAAYGAVEGRIQTLSSRKSLRFTLYEALSDHAVSCYISAGKEDVMREAWGRRAIVEGWVSRDPLTGLPATIRRIRSVEVQPDPAPGSFRQARGAATRQPGEPLAEAAIRALRDGCSAHL